MQPKKHNNTNSKSQAGCMYCFC